MKIKIQLPHDYNSEQDCKAMIAAVYDGDDIAAENDQGGMALEEIAFIMRDSGCAYIGECDHGAEWEGTEEQIKHALEILPSWACVGAIDE